MKSGNVDAGASGRLYEQWVTVKSKFRCVKEWKDYGVFCRDIGRSGLEEEEHVLPKSYALPMGPENFVVAIGGPTSVSRDLIKFNGKYYTIAGAAKFVGLGEQHTANLNNQDKLLERMAQVAEGTFVSKQRIITNEQIRKGLEKTEVLEAFDFDEQSGPRESRKAVFEPLLDGKIYALDAGEMGYESSEHLKVAVQSYIRRWRPDIRLNWTIRRSDGRLIIQAKKIDRPVEEPKRDVSAD